jgi:chromosome segregation ATPase
MDGDNSDDLSNASNTELQNKVRQLELDNRLKDSVINEALAFFNEIQENLETIGARKEEIRLLSENPELTPEDKGWILEEIKHINFLREENANKVKRLQGEIKKNGLKIQEMEAMIESLVKDIQWKDEQITLLQNELDNLDAEYALLFNAYTHTALDLDLLTEEVNSVYYTYGTEEELVKNEVLEKKNGFLGIGKKTSLKDKFNESYFTKIDVTKTKKLKIAGQSLHFISTHQPSSYTLKTSGAFTEIIINDASEFWKISKYLIVVIE